MVMNSRESRALRPGVTNRVMGYPSFGRLPEIASDGRNWRVRVRPAQEHPDPKIHPGEERTAVNGGCGTGDGG